MTQTHRTKAVDKAPVAPRRLDFGTACISGLIVATLVGGLAVISASPVAIAASALGIIAVLIFVIAAMV